MTTVEINAFIEHCKVERGLSEHSLRAYRQDLNAFRRFLTEQHEGVEVGKQTILTFMTHLRETCELNASTIRRRIVTLRALYAWRSKQTPTTTSPFDGLTLELRTPRRLPRPVDRPTLSHLFRASERISPAALDPSKPARRDAVSHHQVTGLVARLLISTGLRIGEVTRIRILDVSSGGSCIRVHGKGDRERTVYVSNEHLLHDLNAYVAMRRETARAGDYLFLNSQGSRLTEAAFRKRLRTVSKTLGISPHITPHRFRHSAATMLIEEGVDIRLVQRLLGHASIATTEIYTKVSDTSLISAIAAADTLAKVDSWLR